MKDDFPIIEIGDLENEISIESLTLFKLIDKTRFAVSNEETRYFLNGIYFHKIEIDNENYLSLKDWMKSKIDYEHFLYFHLLAYVKLRQQDEHPRYHHISLYY